MRVNLHTHTPRCGHAVGSAEEYVLAAIENGFSALGFSDHMPFPLVHGLPVGGRMQQEDFPGYLEELRGLREKYRDKIELYIGLECEPLPWTMELCAELFQQLDYCILGNHGDPCFLRYTKGFPIAANVADFYTYVQDTVNAMETGIFLYVAHPDLIFYAFEKMTQQHKELSRELCSAAKALHIPLEYNISGFQKRFPPNRLGYPLLPFWEIAAEEGAACVIGVDAHSPDRFKETKEYDLAVRNLKRMGLSVLEHPETMIASYKTNFAAKEILFQQLSDKEDCTMRNYVKGSLKNEVWACDTRRAVFDGLNAQVCESNTRPDLLFIGDSITEMFEQAFWLPQYSLVLNRGIGGDVAEGVRFRYDWDVIQLCPKVCVTMVGVNDTWKLDPIAVDLLSKKGTYDELFDMIPERIEKQMLPCYREMAEKCKANDIRLIFCSVTPATHNLAVGRDYRNFFIDTLNAGIKSIAEEYCFDYCDVASPLKDENGQMRGDCSGDGVHPNPHGYRLMLEALKPVLDKYL